MADYQWTSSQGVKVGIEPYLKRGYGFLSIDMHESLNGEIAGGTISISDDTSKEARNTILDTDPLKIYIANPEGRSMEVTGFITGRNFIKNYLTLDFLVIPNKQFLFDWNTSPDKQHGGYEGIKNAIKTLYSPLPCDFRTSSSVPESTPLVQNGISDYRFLKRLAYGYKKNAIFSLGLEGFMVKDLLGVSSNKQQEPDSSYILTGGGTETIKSADDIGYKDKVYKKPIDPWETDNSDSKGCIRSKYFKTIILDGVCHYIHKDAEILFENGIHNENLQESGFYGTLVTEHTHTLPEYRIGDVVWYERRDIETKKEIWSLYVVSDITYHISRGRGSFKKEGTDFVVTSVLKGLIDPQTGKQITKTDDNPLTGWSVK